MNHGLLLGYKIAMLYTLTEAIFLKFWHEGIIFYFKLNSGNTKNVQSIIWYYS
jgi:hypothetical protein